MLNYTISCYILNRMKVTTTIIIMLKHLTFHPLFLRPYREEWGWGGGGVRVVVKRKLPLAVHRRVSGSSVSFQPRYSLSRGVAARGEIAGIRLWCGLREGRKEMFYLTTHSTHFIYGYMASDIWLRTILIVRKETRCRHIGYSYRLTARVLLYAPSHRQDNTYHGLCYTSRGALAGTRNSSMGPPHEGSIRRPTAPWANALRSNCFKL